MLVYLLTFSSGKKYVGQTQRVLSARMSGHRARLKINTSSPLYAEWSACGDPEVKVVERCDSIEELHLAESKWIKQENTIWPNGLNFASGGLSSASKHLEAAKRISKAAIGRVVSDSVKEKLSKSSKRCWENPDYRDKVIAGIHASNTPERLAEIADHLKRQRDKRKEEGWKMSEETKQKMRSRVVTDEQRKKMSESAKKRVRGPRSQETKDKIAAKTKAFWANASAEEVKRRSAQISDGFKKSNPEEIKDKS